MIFEVISDGFPGWDSEDLENFFKEVGEIQLIHCVKNLTIIIYYRYYDAFIAIEFFKNPQNFKDESYKDKFRIKWINVEKDLTEFPKHIIDNVKDIKRNTINYTTFCAQLEKLSVSNSNIGTPINTNNSNYSYYQNSNSRQSQTCNYGNSSNTSTKFATKKEDYLFMSPMQGYLGAGNSQNSTPTPITAWHQPYVNGGTNGYGSNYNISGQFSSNQLKGKNNSKESYEAKSISNFSTPNSGKIYYQNEDDGKGTSGKYTCRFEILIENDKDFQVARKLIGSKGCNMKRIVENCSGPNEYSDVKLRLRGKGSGYKEGPYNRESDDPLHLCISSRNQEKYLQACQLVQDLIATVFEEYKKFCAKQNKTPVSKLALKKEEGLPIKRQYPLGSTDN